MANATKYFAEFRDMYDSQWRINIHDSEFAGTTPTEFTLGASGFVISYKGDTENLFQPIIGSSVEFEFIEQTASHTAFIDALATANESRFTITIERFISGSYELEWFGVLLSDQWSQTNEPLPRSCQMVAADDVGNLNSILYKSSPATAYTGPETLLSHLVNGLTKTRALHPFGTGDVFLNVADDFVAANTNASSRFLENIRTHHESFWNMDDAGNREFMSTFDVLVNICKSQNARLFLARGTWWFVPVGTYQYDTTISFHQYDINGNFQSTTTATEYALDTGTDLRELAGNEKRFSAPLSEAKRARDYNGNAPVIWVPYAAQNAFTTPINDFGVDYFVGQQINFIGSVNVTLPGVDPSFGLSDAELRVGRIAVGVQFKCGNQYATAPITFAGQGNFGFDDGAVGNYDLANYGVLSWSGSAGSTQFLSEPFDRNIGTNQTIGLVFTTDVLPSTQSSLEITLSISLVLYDGTFVAIDTGLNVADEPTYTAQNLRAFRADVDGGGSEITYTAAGDEVNRAIKIDDVVVLGDRIGDSDRGVLDVKTGASSWSDATGWNSLNYTGAAVGINRLAVAEILRTMRAPIPIFAGSFNVGEFDTIGSLVSMVNVLTFGTDTYMFTEFTLQVNDRILDFEVARIQRSTASITEEISGKKQTTIDVVPGGFNPQNDMVGLANAIGSTTTAIDNLESTTAAIQAKTDFIDVTQPVDLDTMESKIVTNGINIGTNATNIGTNATNIGGITSTLAILKETFQPKGDDGNPVTKIVYENGKTDGLEMTLSPTTASFTSNSGNSQLSITESSPGVFEVDLQDDGTDSVLAIYATAASRKPLMGIGTNTPSHTLDVNGGVHVVNDIDLDGSLRVGGDVYVFKYLSTTYGLFFNLTSPGFEFHGAGSAVRFRINAQTGAVTIANAYTLPTTDGNAGQLMRTNGNGTISFVTINLNDIADVSAATPTNGQVLTWDNSAQQWTAADQGGGGGGGSDSFATIAVAGQSDVVAESGNDTLTMVAGSNVVITTDATADSITYAVTSTPTFTSVLSTTITAVGAIAAIGDISTNANMSAGGTFTSGGNATFQGDATISGDLYTTNLQFIGNGTSVIGVSNAAGNEPDDLEIRSNGNVVVVLDYDDDETGQSFEIKSGDGTTIFKVDESGFSSGLFTTTTPIIATIADFEATQTQTISVTNYDSNATYLVQLFDSSDNVVNHTITDNNDGTWTIVSGLTPAAGYYVTIQSLGFGLLVSATATSNAFECLAAQTQKRFWRLQLTDANKNPVSLKLALGNFRLYTATGGGGTAYPSNMTSFTAPSPFVASAGYTFSSTYEAWKAFDSNIGAAGSMWWSLGGSVAANNWIQIDLGASIDFGNGECQIRTSGGWTDANFAVLYGSDTGAFAGEEREMAFFQNIDKPGESGGTFTTYTQPIT